MPTFKLEDLDDSFGGDNDMYFRQWRAPSMKPVLERKLDRDFQAAVEKKDDFLRKRAEAKQKHGERFEKRLEALNEKMKRVELKENRPLVPEEKDLKKLREKLESEFQAPSSTAKMSQAPQLRPKPRQTPLFGPNMAGLKNLVLPPASTPVFKNVEKPETPKDNSFLNNSQETVFYPQANNSFNLDHYNGTRPSFAFGGLNAATSTPVSKFTPKFSVGSKIDEEQSFDESKYVTAIESPVFPKSSAVKAREDELRAEQARVESLKAQKAREAAEEAQRVQKAQEAEVQARKAAEEERKAREAAEEAQRVKEVREAEVQAQKALIAQKAAEEERKAREAAEAALKTQKAREAEVKARKIEEEARKAAEEAWLAQKALEAEIQAKRAEKVAFKAAEEAWLVQLAQEADIQAKREEEEARKADEEAWKAQQAREAEEKARRAAEASLLTQQAREAENQARRTEEEARKAAEAALLARKSQQTEEIEDSAHKLTSCSRIGVLFKNYIGLLAQLKEDKRTYESVSNPVQRSLIKRTITERVTLYTQRETSHQQRDEILHFFQSLLLKKPVNGFVIEGPPPKLQLADDTEMYYAVNCLVEKYISLAELDSELAVTIGDLISRLGTHVKRVEKVFIVMIMNASVLLRQNPDECIQEFVDSEAKSDEKAMILNRENALVTLFFNVLAKSAYMCSKGLKKVLNEDLMWKIADSAVANAPGVPQSAVVVLQMILTCKPLLCDKTERWNGLLDKIWNETLPEIEEKSFPGDEAAVSNLRQFLMRLDV